MRGGRVRGQRGWIVESQESQEIPELAGRAISDTVLRRPAALDDADESGPTRFPSRKAAPCLPSNAEELGRPPAAQGSCCGYAPRGRRALAETVHRTAEDALQQHKLKRASDFNADPLRCRAFRTVGPGRRTSADRVSTSAMCRHRRSGHWCSEDGLPRKSDYRHFGIREAAGQRLTTWPVTAEDPAPLPAAIRAIRVDPIFFLRKGSRVIRLSAQSVRRRRRVASQRVSAAPDEFGVTDVAASARAKRLRGNMPSSGPDYHAAQQ